MIILLTTLLANIFTANVNLDNIRIDSRESNSNYCNVSGIHNFRCDSFLVTEENGYISFSFFDTYTESYTTKTFSVLVNADPIEVTDYSKIYSIYAKSLYINKSGDRTGSYDVATGTCFISNRNTLANCNLGDITLSLSTD